MRVPVVPADSMAPRPLRAATLIVPQPSKIFPLPMIRVFAPMEPEAMTARRWPLAAANGIDGALDGETVVRAAVELTAALGSLIVAAGAADRCIRCAGTALCSDEGDECKHHHEEEWSRNHGCDCVSVGSEDENAESRARSFVYLYFLPMS